MATCIDNTMHVDGIRCATVISKCVFGTLTHPGAHICALLETRSQPLTGNINTPLQQCGCAGNQ
eukprot:403372-Ditylum_brightwellii.AAC.1